MDFGTSDDPRVQAQLDRLNALSLASGRINLDTMTALMERLGNPQDRLPPVFHVAGTNGKGSTCAFLRAMLEAQGYRVHVTTSPHLVRYNERIRVAGELIEDARLAELLEEVFDAAEVLSPSFFEVTIAVALVEFSRVPADACVVEVGLGGRLDATNILKPHVLAACGIAALGMDHERFLLAPEDGVPAEPMARIAFEKAGIAKEGVPLVTLGYEYPPAARNLIEHLAKSKGALLHSKSNQWIHSNRNQWSYSPCESDFYFSDMRTDGAPEIYPKPLVHGDHQVTNASLALAMLRIQDAIQINERALQSGICKARWPARMQLLREGPLTALTSAPDIWLDGGHNASAGDAIADTITGPIHLILGMLAAKDPRALTKPFGDRIRTLQIVPVPNHESHSASAFRPDAVAQDNLQDAMLNVPNDGFPVLIAGSLYLAGEALRLNDEIPD